MRDIHRNPILYYLLIPALIGIWPLMVWVRFLPKAEKELGSDCSLLRDATGDIEDILVLDPQITDRTDPNRVVGEFSYGKAVDRAANLCAIPAKSRSYTAQNIMNVGGKKRRDGRVTLKDISVVQTAKFLSLMQSTWVNLQCDGIELSKRKGMPDQWEVDISFIYYY
jgi:hypothetical protein